MKKLQTAKKRMHCNYAFYFGAEKDNIKEIKKVEKVKGCCGVKVFVGSSTGTLLVSNHNDICLLYTSPSPRDPKTSRMPSSA